MNKILFFFGMWIVTISPLFAASSRSNQLAVAVFEFSGDAAMSNLVVQASSMVVASLGAETNFYVLERQKLGNSAEQRAFIASGTNSPAEVARIGKLTGANALVSVHGQVTDSLLTLEARIFSTGADGSYHVEAKGDKNDVVGVSIQLANKITQTILGERKSFQAIPNSREERLKRMVEDAKNPNLPTLSIDVYFQGQGKQNTTVSMELGSLLLRAGFTVLDGKFKSNSDLEINGVSTVLLAPKKNEVTFATATLEIKVQSRKTGKMIIAEKTVSTVSGMDQNTAIRVSRVNTADLMADKLVPLLVKPLE